MVKLGISDYTIPVTVHDDTLSLQQTKPSQYADPIIGRLIENLCWSLGAYGSAFWYKMASEMSLGYWDWQRNHVRPQSPIRDSSIFPVGMEHSNPPGFSLLNLVLSLYKY